MDAPSQSQLTVHALRARHSEKSAESSTSQEDALLLNQGRALVQDAFGDGGWHAPSPKFDLTVFNRQAGKAYVFARPPPRIQVEGTPTSPKLKEWGAPLSPSDVFTLDELALFQPNLPDKTPPPPSQPPPTKASARRPFSPSPADTQPPPKRLKLDLRSLDSVIPEPHYHAAPYHTSPRHPALGEPYTRTAPTALPPHTPNSLPAFLASPFVRLAWIVPVRGTPPWDGATPASITDDEDTLPHGCDSNTIADSNSILWTHASLLEFWMFLLRCLRAVQLAPTSLSFHTAPSSSAGSSLVEPSSPYFVYGANRDISGVQAPGTMSGEGSTVPPLVPRKRLLDVDHIKVFCDAPRAMILRNLLDAWKYEIDDPDDSSDAADGKARQKRKIRVLRCARLVLVDKKSAGVLLS
ncbi:hypothetical protein DENSPDRAFT_835077 [Dentipellis sp. KUC8613]|nr:hypothetical protein DENSPDRAFT_835077 [Dentipellis sp. KUC8613]